MVETKLRRDWIPNTLSYYNRLLKYNRYIQFTVTKDIYNCSTVQVYTYTVVVSYNISLMIQNIMYI